MSDAEEITLVEPEPMPKVVTLEHLFQEIRSVGQAVRTLSAETTRLHERVTELADGHGERILRLERAAEQEPPTVNGHG